MSPTEQSPIVPAFRFSLLRTPVEWLAGLGGLLLVRLVLLLFAVRPSNPVATLLLAVTAPVVWPLHWLDRWVGQPQWGARLELATVVALLLLVAGMTGLLWQQQRRRS